MKKLELELKDEEYDMLVDVLKKITDEKEVAPQQPKKWIHDGMYMVNTHTGARLNKFTKRRD